MKKIQRELKREFPFAHELGDRLLGEILTTFSQASNDSILLTIKVSDDPAM